MPTIPAIKATTGRYTSVGILNHIISDPNNNLLNGINPIPDGLTPEETTKSLRAIGEQITSFQPRLNQFVNSMINRVGMVRLHYMLFNNPWSWAKQGKLEMGETIEQIWIGLAEAFPYNPHESESTFAKQMPPEVSTAFHSINYREVYKVTVNQQLLKQAFLSLDGLQNFIEDIIGSVYRSAEVDEFMAMKYLLAVLLLAGKIRVEQINPIDATTASEVVTTVAATTNLFQFPSTNYNMAGVLNTTPIDRLYILESATANAQIKVNSLATAFNIDEVKFMGHVVMYDSLATYDWNRMDKIFKADPNYARFTNDELTLLKSVDLIAMDQRFMQIYDSLEQMGEPFINGEGMYTNYPYHVWKVLSASPFHNCIAFSTTGSTVTGISITPATVTAAPGAAVAFTADVETTGFAGSGVTWEISTQGVKEGTFIGQDGILRIAPNETAASISVVVTSNFDETKTATATVTVSA